MDSRVARRSCGAAEECMLEALFAVVPVFLIIGMGVLLRAREVLPESAGPVLGVYVLKLALPLLILHILAGAHPGDLAHGGFWAGVIGSQLIVYALGYWGDRLFCRRGAGPAVISALSCSACNTAFVGLPIVTNLLPGNQEALLIAGLATLTTNIVMIMGQARLDMLAGAAAWSDGSRSRVATLLRVFILGNPILLATLAGVALSLSGLGLWAPLDRTVSLVGYTAAPCMLLALGLDLRQKLALAMHRAEGHAALRQVWLISCKLLLHPLLCWAIMWLLGISGAWLAIGVIMSGTATALIVTVLAEIYGAVPEESALTAVLSNALSMFTLTGFVWLFMRLGMI